VRAVRYAEIDIEVRVVMAKNVFDKLKPILTGGLRQETKKKVVKTLIRSVVTYASETRTLWKADVSKLEASEICLLRCVERIRWVDRRTCARLESLLQTTLEGRMEGTQPRGRKRIRMVGDIRNGSTYAEMKRRAKNREEWRVAL